jgi:hypothetical protein
VALAGNGRKCFLGLKWCGGCWTHFPSYYVISEEERERERALTRDERGESWELRERVYGVWRETIKCGG